MAASSYLLPALRVAALLLMLVPAFCFGGEFYAGLTLNAGNESVSECRGNCSLPHHGEHGAFSGLLVGYYFGNQPLALGLQAILTDESNLQLMLRRRVGDSSFAIGAGVVDQRAKMKRGDNTAIGDGLLQADDAAFIYSIGFERSLGIGRVGLIAAFAQRVSEFTGRTVVGFDVAGRAIFSSSSATARVEHHYVFISYAVAL